MKDHKFESALKEFERAKGYDADVKIIRMYLARLYLIEKKYGKAEEELQALKAMDPDDLEVRTLLVLLYREEGRTQDVKNELELLLKKACSIYPDNLGMFLFLADFYMKEDDLDAAAKVLISYYEKHPDDKDVLFYIGGLYYEKKDYDNAEKYWVEFFKKNKEDADALNSLAYLYALQGRNLKKALIYVKKALEKDPENGAYLDTLGWIYFRQGKFRKALTFLQDAAKRVQDAVIYDHLGEVYFKLKDFVNAKISWEKSLELKRSEEVERKLENVKQILKKEIRKNEVSSETH